MADTTVTGAPTPLTDEEVAGYAPASPEAQPVVKPFKLPSISKRKSFKVDEEEVVKSVIDRYNQDLTGRTEWEDDRLQRYAKLRGWREPKQYPWPNASNAHVPIMMSNSQRLQDTLHNAVLTSRPCINAIPIHKTDADKGSNVDTLLDYQFFGEQHGEEKAGDIISSFVDEGKIVVYVAWVEDYQRVIQSYPVGKLPEGAPPQEWLAEKLRTLFTQHAEIEPKDEDGTRWLVTDLDPESGEVVDSVVEFAQDRDDMVFMFVEREVCIYDGPCVFPKAIEDVIVPANAANLQAPSPSNPKGAQHVMLRDFPTEDELRRLQEDGTYDLVSKKELKDSLEASGGQSIHDGGNDGKEPTRQKAALAGQDPETAEGEYRPKTFTRLKVFDRWDVNDDGLEEDVEFTVIVETRQLLRAKYMTELYPFRVPRRPLVSADLLPVPGQFYGISLLELVESIQDLMTTMLNQSVDSAQLSNMPIGFYRATSGLRPEVLHLSPGDMIPTADPQKDFAFPQLGNSNQNYWINMLTMLQQWSERETMQGELQMGRIPVGKSAALRTSGNMQAVLQQGDARPERILRRLFRGIAEVFELMHMLNEAYLRPNKEYRVLGNVAEKDTPYKTIADPSQMKGIFNFSFKANVLNTSKANFEATMNDLAMTLISPLMIQLGIVDQERIYNITHDMIKSKGVDPDRYTKRPPTLPDVPSVMAEEAIIMLMNGEMPQGKPAEGAQAHAMKLMEFHNSPAFVYMKEAEVMLYSNYLRDVIMLAQHEQQQQAMAAAATPMGQPIGQQPQGQGQPGAPPQGPPQPPGPAQQLNPNELMDESLGGQGAPQ